MLIFICKLDPHTQNTQKRKESQGGGLRLPTQRGGPSEAAHPFVDILIYQEFLCILGLGVELTYKNRLINSGKHAQELCVDF